MLDTAIDGPEHGEQSGPGIVTAVEHFRTVAIGFFRQLPAQVGNGIAPVVDRIAEKEQPTFLGAEDEHQSHHYRQPGLVELSGFHVAEQVPVAVLVGLVETLHEHLDRTTDLLAEGIGDLLVMLEGFVQKRFQGVFRRAETAPDTEQRLKGLQRDRLLKPETGVPRCLAGCGADRRVDQHPSFAIGQKPHAHAMGAAEQGHTLLEGNWPTITSLDRFEIGIRRQNGEK